MGKQIIIEKEPMDVVRYVRAIAMGDYKTLKSAGHLAESDDAQGGFFVPEKFLDDIYGYKTEESIVRPRAMLVSMTTDSQKGPRTVETSRADGTMFGGISYSWQKEGAELKTLISKPKLGQLELNSHKLIAMFWASNELISDSRRFDKFVKNTFMRGLSFIMDDAFINGTGVGEILGILNANALIPVPRQTMGAVDMMDLGRMARRLTAESWQSKSTVWILNQDVVEQLFDLTMSTANAGVSFHLNDRYLFGLPIFVSSTCPALGTLGDVILADFSHYCIADRDLTLASSSQQSVDSTGWLTDETLFRLTARLDAQSLVDNPIIPRRGLLTVSPFVALSETIS